MNQIMAMIVFLLKVPAGRYIIARVVRPWVNSTIEI
jgi:hypothetical protein